MSSRSQFVRLTPKSFWSLALLAPLCAPHFAAAQAAVKTQPGTTAKSSVFQTDSIGGIALDAPQQIALPDSVPAAVANAVNLGPMDGGQKLSVLICFGFADPQAAQAYADAVSNPNSLLYRQWLTPQEIGEKFGPGADDYAAMLNFIQANGLNVEELPMNRLTLSVSGTAAQMQQAFGTTLNKYLESTADARQMRGADAVPYEFYAPAAPVLIPAALAGKITSIAGLETYTRPIMHSKKAKLQSSLFDALQARTGYNLSPMYDALNAVAANKPGTGRTIGISNFDGFSVAKNAGPFIDRNNLPYPAAGKASNITVTTVGPGSVVTHMEGDLDFQAVLGQAPLANIIIYDSAGGLLPVLAKEVSDNKADVLTESYGWALSAGDADSAHTLHMAMTMQGQTYLTASGDSGNVAGDSYQYSDYDPEVLVIGGTTLTVNSSNSFSSEAGWPGSGGGICAASNFFNSLPAWQNGRAVPTVNKRLSPDISSHSAGFTGGAYNIFYKGALKGISGTSCASPVDAGDFALMEQYLISQNALPGKITTQNGLPVVVYRLGRINDLLYSYNGRSDIFNDTTGGVSNGAGTTAKYWDYVTGWGSVNWYNLATALARTFTMPAAPALVVTVTPAIATVTQGQPLQLSASVAGSNVQTVTWSLVSGPGTISASGVYTPPATLSAPATVVVKAISAVDTAPPGYANATYQPTPYSGQATLTVQPVYRRVSGNVNLEGIDDLFGTIVPVSPITFVFTPSGGGTPITSIQTLGPGGSFTVSGLPSGAYTVKIKGDKWLRASAIANLGSADITNLSANLLSGDANNDNSVDSTDFGILIGAFNSNLATPGSGYDPAADLNNDGVVDSSDFGLMISNYGLMGQ